MVGCLNSTLHVFILLSMKEGGEESICPLPFRETSHTFFCIYLIDKNIITWSFLEGSQRSILTGGNIYSDLKVAFCYERRREWLYSGFRGSALCGDPAHGHLGMEHPTLKGTLKKGMFSASSWGNTVLWNSSPETELVVVQTVVLGIARGSGTIKAEFQQILGLQPEQHRASRSGKWVTGSRKVA